LVWQAGSVALVALEGTAGLWLSVKANVPPGAAIAVLAGGVFVVAAGVRELQPRLRLVAGAATLLVLLTGCGSGSRGHALPVVATTTQIADWVRVVGDGNVQVHQILQPNTDPHEYEPRPADVAATSGTRIVFENGDGLDHWMDK